MFVDSLPITAGTAPKIEKPAEPLATDPESLLWHRILAEKVESFE